ncbi:fas-binding factor 1 homolog isoform X3 [Betta splendens]|uniref:Fas-binding factor 1 homolog isoform X3 n=1 Tax=Betta splendens TaxID=158456 RepID=A0A6P7N6F9_BETSP|nr:fas-binding factor 1 homolog isoform X3 [Betta splendens]
MPTKPKDKSSKSLFESDDLLDLLEDKKPPIRGKAIRSGPLSRSSATENIFSMLAGEVKQDGGDTEDSDISAADPNDILKNMKDMDDMDADLFALKKKPNSAQTKSTGNERTKKDFAALENNVKPEGADEPNTEAKKPDSAPSTSTARTYKKFTFSESVDGSGGLGQSPLAKDLNDPLADLLDDLLPDKTESESKTGTQLKPENSPAASPVLKTKMAKKPSELTFDDENYDLMDALGFDNNKNNPKKTETPLLSNKERSEVPQRSRTRLDEILDNLASPRATKRPPTGEMKDNSLTQEKQQQEKTFSIKEPPPEGDLTFGSYQPTVGSTVEGRQSRRQSVRFSTEDVRVSTPERKLKPASPTAARQRKSSDWLGLRANDESTFLEHDGKEVKSSVDSPKAPSSPLLERKPSLTGKHVPAAGKGTADTPDTQKEEEGENDDWLAGALSRKKAVSNSEAKTIKQEEHSGLEGNVDAGTIVSNQVTSQAPRDREDTFTAVKETSEILLGPPTPAAHSTPVRDERPKQAVPQLLHTSTAVQPQVVFPADSLQHVLLQQQTMQSQLLGLGGVADAGILQRVRDREKQSGDYQTLQTRIIQLEGQVKTLQLERDQCQMLLESIQQRHKQDVELMENMHKSRVKLLEESTAQRDTRARQEYEELMERLSTVTRSAEQERSELQAQYQRKLAQAQQDRDREVDRLRDLQRKSILEMKKDHEDQIQRLKKLKDEEIDAVTSATSQTRSLTLVIEQMEQFSSRLGELSSRVESTHEHTAHGLEQGARHRDEQLRIMQDRLNQQQKTMADERAYLKEIISRMDTQLNEQQRQLEKERWKMTAEQAKAESTQRTLEEERHALSMQISIEREELERAKSSLLEEQKSVMQRCAEERRKLAAEWAHFHAQEKQRYERTEREVSSLLEKREGSIMSLAQDQADLKLRTAELKQKEMVVVQERETLERLREELERERERVTGTALRLKTRAQEVEAFSKLSAEKYEEGERALQEAKRVEAEHEARLRNIHIQTEQLRQQEQRILQDRIRLNHLQETNRLRPDPPAAPLTQVISPILTGDSGSVVPNPDLSSTLNVPPPTSQSMVLQASMALWKYTAEKDREFLQEEQLFLENLKKKSYKLYSSIS